MGSGTTVPVVEVRELLLELPFFLLGAALRLETPTLELSASVFVRRPGAGRRFRRPELFDEAALRVFGEVGVPFGRLALLDRRKLVRRFGGSSETALPALRVIVGLRVAGGVAARWLRAEAVAFGDEDTPAGASGTLDVPAESLSFFGAGPALDNGSGVSGIPAGIALVDGVDSLFRFFCFSSLTSAPAGFPSTSAGASSPCSRAIWACSACSSNNLCRFNFFASLSLIPRLINS